MVATETEDLVIGSVLLVGGVAVAVASLLLGARWWFVLPALVVAAVVKRYAWSQPLDERKLAAAPETVEQPRIRASEVLLRLLPSLVVWFGLDIGLLLTNPNAGGAAGGGVNIGVGLAWLATGRALVRYGRRHSVVIISDAPHLYGFWSRSDNLLRARRAT
jgi:hypothetical protein